MQGDHLSLSRQEQDSFPLTPPQPGLRGSRSRAEQEKRAGKQAGFIPCLSKHFKDVHLHNLISLLKIKGQRRHREIYESL